VAEDQAPSSATKEEIEIGLTDVWLYGEKTFYSSLILTFIVIHKCPGNPSYPPGSGYPVPWMVSLIHPWSLDSGTNPYGTDLH